MADHEDQSVYGFSVERASTALGILAALAAGGTAELSESYLPGNGSAAGDALIAGKLAFAGLTVAEIARVRRAGTEITTLPWPGGDSRAPLSGIHYLAISPDSRHKEEAWRLVEWLATKAQANLELGGLVPANIEAVPARNAVFPGEGPYGTIASEKNLFSAAAVIKDPVLDKVWREMVGALAEGRSTIAETVTGLDGTIRTSIVNRGGRP